MGGTKEAAASISISVGSPSFSDTESEATETSSKLGNSQHGGGGDSETSITRRKKPQALLTPFNAAAATAQCVHASKLLTSSLFSPHNGITKNSFSSFLVSEKRA
jgi:hypothetical protein